jgi:hypothetical protein
VAKARLNTWPSIPGWVNRNKQAVIDYLLEENRVLRAVNGSRRLRLTDDQRRVSP